MEEKTRTERYQGCKIFIFLILCIAQLIVISAFEFDNIKNYDEVTNTIDIRNSVLGIPFLQLDSVANIKLITPQVNYVIDRGDGIMQLVAETEFNNFQKDYSNALNKLELYNLKTDTKFQRIFEYRYRTIIRTEQKPIYESVCSGSIPKCTENNLVRTETINIYSEWKTFKEVSELPEGKVYVGIFTDILPSDNIEWVPTWFGVEIDEWATWTVGLNTGLVSYYTFNNNAGTMLNDSLGLYNGTLVNMLDTDWKSGSYCKLNGCLNFTDVIDFVNISNAQAFNLQEYTINVWIKSSGNSSRKILGKGLDSGYTYNYWMLLDNQDPNFLAGNSTAGSYAININPNIDITKDIWEMITIKTNKTQAKLYLNGTEIGVDNSPDVRLNNYSFTLARDNNDALESGFGYTGGMDELGVWNRSLTDAEISDLWNDGSGITYSATGAGNLAINLIYPTNSLTVTDTTINFNATLTPTSLNITNATIYVWNSTNNIIVNKTNIIGLNYSLYNNWSIPGFELKSYKWNVYACGLDAVLTTECSWGSSNYTFTVSPYSVIAERYNEITTEGSLETYGINISTTTGYQVSTADLVYNQTSYSGTLTNPSSNFYTITKILATPNVTANTNNTFYWNITLSSGTTSSSPLHNQTVINFGIDNCSSYKTLLYNFSLVDEITQESFSPTFYNVSNNLNVQLYTLDRSHLVENYTNSNNATNNFLVCLNSNLTSNEQYSLDLQVQYDASGYASEFYNMKNTTISKSSLGTNITLYDLIDSKSQEFVLSFKDSTFLPVVDALIQVQRKYVSEGLFKTVEIPITDTNGETIAHLQLADTIYTFVVTKNGVILGTFNNLLAVCQDIILGNCDINFNSASSYIKTKDFSVLDDLSFTLTFNKDTNVIQSIFTVPSGTPKSFALNATLFDAIGSTEVCSDTLISSSGTLTCTIPSSVGNGTVLVNLISNGKIVGKTFINVGDDSKDLYGSNIMFLTLFLFLTLIGVGISSEPMITGFFLLIGAILSVGLNLIYTPSFVGVGATILWLFIAIILVLIKGAKRQ